MDKYLKASKFINYDHPSVQSKASELARGLHSDVDIAKNCFEFVRDEIKHSMDFKLNPVTCIASDVLKFGTGYCYAKSHLLAALLRYNNIPTGLCYQRLTITDKPPFCIHGLNTIYLKKYGWYRVDARGNKLGVDAYFEPPLEKLAFPIITVGEADIAGIWSDPMPEVVNVLTRFNRYDEVAANLPDIIFDQPPTEY